MARKRYAPKLNFQLWGVLSAVAYSGWIHRATTLISAPGGQAPDWLTSKGQDLCAAEAAGPTRMMPYGGPQTLNKD